MFSIMVYGGFEHWCKDVSRCTGVGFVVYGCFILGCTDVCEMSGCLRDVRVCGLCNLLRNDHLLLHFVPLQYSTLYHKLFLIWAQK